MLPVKWGHRVVQLALLHLPDAVGNFEIYTPFLERVLCCTIFASVPLLDLGFLCSFVHLLLMCERVHVQTS